MKRNTIISKSASLHLDEILTTIEVGIWDWEVPTGKVIYSVAWGKILGYTIDELPQEVDTWEKMVLPEDLAHANHQIQKHLSGEKLVYEAEFRMVCKDGTIIWAQDKGKVIEYDEEGNPLRFVGVLQNVTRLKNAELLLLENQETLDLAVSVAELGTWDWDIVGDCIRYNDEYLKMLGYSQSDMNGSMEEWESMNHPEDLPHSMKLLDAYIAGEIEAYECEIRMKHRDGRYIWTRDVGKIVKRDADGTPMRLIGGHLNIDKLKQSEKRITEALEALEYNNTYLESEVKNRTKALVEQDEMLWTVNQISRKLLAFNSKDNFEELVKDCLRLLGESINKNRVYIWKDQSREDGKVYCTQIYEWVLGVASIQGEEQFEEISYDDLPAFAEAIDANRCLNSLIRDLSDSEKNILVAQGVKTILIAPIAINGKGWGFIGVDNCEEEQLFTSIEENMLFMSGSMIANTIEKMETEARIREVEERTQIMLDATPLCCNLWNSDFQNINCNEEAVRLFELPSQEEYLKRFNELSPKYQPSGQLSTKLAAEYIAKAFKDGYCRFEWMHQKIDGTPIPAEITLVRIKYKDSFIVAGYTHDLRNFNEILSTLHSKEDDLRSARDEALLSSKAKSNFLANMSHEIRTPMNAISGLAEIMLRESEGEKAAEYARGIKSASSNLLNIINDILDISKIESGKLEVFKTPYELASLLNDVITISRMRLGNKQLMFITDIDSHLPAQLVGDEIRIKQILINLLSNAIKFTKEGYIALRVSGKVEGDKTTLRFSVKDSGVGIMEDDIQRLFAEFERVNTTKNRKIEGTGLGLAISKQLCEMMDGRIEVQSVYGKGSEFAAVIPQECPSYQRLSQVQEKKRVLLYEPRDLYRKSIAESLENLECNCVPCANQSELYDNIHRMSYNYIMTAALHLKKVRSIVEKNKLTVPIAVFVNYGEQITDKKVYTILFPVSCLQLAHLLNGQFDSSNFLHNTSLNTQFIAPKARVLVVDDNPVNLCVAEGLMAPYKFIIDTAENGLEAVKKVQQNQYDLVLMDHMMPEMDGIDATVAIRALKEDYYQKLPIIALTANAIVGTREMFIREGMNDFLAKPIEINKLGNVLGKWLPQDKIEKIKLKDTLEKEKESLPLSIQGVNTTQGILSVGGSIENYLQILAAYYADGNQKSSLLLHHMKEKNILAFCTQVHALKSTSATIGAIEVSTRAAKLEKAALKNDVEYMNTHMDEFLMVLKMVLEEIKPLIQTDSAMLLTKKDQSEREKGDISYLRVKLPILCEAMEIANITKIEELMDKLQVFMWEKNIDHELICIRESLAVFDYDLALESVVRLQEVVS